MEANIYNFEKRANTSPRNKFKMDHSKLFNSACGEILPSFVMEVMHGDKVSLGLHNITRTRSVNTAAFMSFDEVTDFFFVPFRLIWSPWEQWQLMQSFPRSTMDLQQVGLQSLVPYTTYTQISNFFLSSNNPSSTVNTVKLVTYPNFCTALKYLDMLGYGLVPINGVTSSVNYFSNASASSSDLFAKIRGYLNQLGSQLSAINYFRLAAFQCIYMAHYRNEEYEKLDPSYYNVDSLFSRAKNFPVAPGSTSSAGSASDVTRLNWLVSDSEPNLSLPKLFTPRYKNWRRDLFTSLKPKSGFDQNAPVLPSSSSGRGGSDFSWPSNTLKGQTDQFGANFSNLFPGEINDVSISLPAKQVSADPLGYATQIYAHNIRTLMAADKFSRAMIYADKDYKSQFRAIFGIEAKEPNVPRYLGSFSNTVEINEVVATAAGNDGEATMSQSSVLGQLAGKGYSNRSDKVFETSFDEDGVIIGMHYIMPRNNYDSYRVDRFNTKLSRFDYFYPQFDGMGLQPVYAFERNLSSQVFDGNEPSPIVPITVTGILGFAARYHEYKCKQSECHGSFVSNQPDMNWTLTNNQFGVVSASDMNNYKINPKITDRIFDMSYDGSPASAPFMCYYNYNVTKFSNMEVDGTPSI